MFGVPKVLLLTCGVIAIQAQRHSNYNSNSNSNMMSRRNYNSNSNNNIVGLRHSPYNDDGESEPQMTLQDIRDKLLSEGNPEGAMIVSAAADAVMAITKTLADELSGTTAIAVADAVAEILTDHRFAPNYRRNSNYNSNTNMNVARRDNSNGETDGLIIPEEAGSLPIDIAAALGIRSLESGETNADGYAEDLDAKPFGLSDDDLIDDDIMNQSPSSRGMSSNRNSNTNVNSNLLNYPPIAYRRNFNSNSNKNSFRRNNVNSNMNNNHIRGHRYRRD